MPRNSLMSRRVVFLLCVNPFVMKALCFFFAALLGGGACIAEDQIPGDPPLSVQKGWTVYIEKGDSAAAQKLFSGAVKESPQSFLAWSSLSQMYIQQARNVQAAEALIQGLELANWDEYSEPAVRDLESLLAYLPERKRLTAAIVKRIANPQVSWLEQECLRELQEDVLWLDGDTAELAALREKQNFVSEWLLLGPFSNRNHEGFDKNQEVEATFDALDLAKKWRGRDREIGWFSQRAPQNRLLNLGMIFYPGSESLGYACVDIEGDSAMSATLAVDQNGASALWLNGRQVYSDGVYCNNNGRLQRLIGVELQKGKNQVVCKIAGDLKCGMMLSLRVVPLPISELDKAGSAALAQSRRTLLRYGVPTSVVATGKGKGAGGVTTVSKVADVDQKGGGADAAKDEAPVKQMPVTEELREVAGDPGIFWGALQVFAERAGNSGNDPLATMNMAYLLRARGLSDTNYSRERRYNEDLARRYSSCPLFLSSAAFCQPDENRTRVLLEKGLAVSGLERAIADDLLRLSVTGGFDDQALARGKELVDKYPTYNALNAIASVYLRREWDAEALRVLQEARAGLPASGDLVVRIARLMAADLAKRTLLEDSLRTVRVPDNEVALAAVLFDLREYAAADAAYLAQARRVAYNENYWDKVAATRVARGDYLGAAAVIKEGLQWMPQSPELLEKQGRLLLSAGKKEAGLELLRQSLAIRSDNPRLQSYVRELSPQEKPFYERCEVAFKDLPGLEATSDDYPDYDSVILLDQAFIRVNPNGTARRMYRSIVKVLRQRGAADAARMEYPYDPTGQRVEIVRARVWNSDGSYTENSTIDDRAYGQDGQAAMMYGSGGRVRQVALPQVKEGAIVEFQWTVEDSGEQLYHNEYCDDYFFGGMEPAKLFRYTIEYPAQIPLRYAVANADYQPRKSEENGIACLDWEVQDIPGIKPEPNMPPYPEIKAQIGVTTFRDEQQLGAWAWSLFAPQMELTAEMKQKVAQLIKHTKTREEKIRAIYDFVVDEIRYVSISFGRFGYVPHKVERTFSSRYGDCKDTAALFVALLKEAGVEASPVLVRTRSRGEDPLGLPSSDDYDHSIAYVPAGKEGGEHYWLDGTVDYHPLGVIPFMDRGTRALVFGPKQGKELVVDPALPEQNVGEVQIEAVLSAGGAGALTLRGIERGEKATYFMSMLEKPDALKYMISAISQERYPGGTVSDVELAEPGRKEEITYAFKISSPTLARKSGAELRIKTTFFPEDLSGLTTLSTRKYDLLLGQPRIEIRNAKLTIPAGAQWNTIPADLALQTSAATFSRKTTRKGRQLDLTSTFTVRATRVSPQEYEEFKRFCNSVSAALDETITYSEATGAAPATVPAERQAKTTSTAAGELTSKQSADSSSEEVEVKEAK